MKKNSLFIILSLGVAFVSCSENKQKDETKDNFTVDRNSETSIIKEARKKLNLKENDKAILSIHKAFLNEDTILDSYVNVNLSGKVDEDYTSNKNPASFSEIGYLGKYNYIVPFDGKTLTLGVPYMIGSNGKEELQLTELNLISPSFKILQVNYRVKNGGFSTFLQLQGDKFVPIFAYKRFDYIGTDKAMASYMEIIDNPTNLTKDIDIYEGELLNYNSDKAFDNPTYYDVKIGKTNKLIRHFFYEKSMKTYASMKTGQ